MRCACVGNLQCIVSEIFHVTQMTIISSSKALCQTYKWLSVFIRYRVVLDVLPVPQLMSHLPAVTGTLGLSQVNLSATQVSAVLCLANRIHFWLIPSMMQGKRMRATSEQGCAFLLAKSKTWI
jgi:hypothetical protein